MCNVLRSGYLGPYEDLVLQPAYCLAFFGFLRCGEFTSRSNTFDPLTDLSMGDIQFHIYERYFTLQLKRSNTDPFCKGVTLKYFATEQNICPFQTMMALQQTRNDMVAQSHDPLFTTLKKASLTLSFLIEKLKMLLLNLGYNPSLYSDHSFQIGAATTPAAAHIPDNILRTLSRWNSDCYCR